VNKKHINDKFVQKTPLNRHAETRARNHDSSVERWLDHWNLVCMERWRRDTMIGYRA
jgi:hypothetical protein